MSIKHEELLEKAAPLMEVLKHLPESYYIRMTATKVEIVDLNPAKGPEDF